MAKFFSIGLEDEEVGSSDLEDESTEKPDELEKANHMVTNEESTDPIDVVKIANYKEELEKIKEGSGEESDSDYGDDTESSDASDSSSDSDSDMDSDDSGESDSEEVDDEADDSDSEDEDTESDEEEESNEDTDSDKTETSDEGMSDSDVSKLNDATESYKVLCKINELVRNGNERNNLSTVAVEMIDITLDRIKNRLNFIPVKRTSIPAFEDISGFTSRKKYTEKLTEALEGIVGDIWDAIVRMFKAIINWFGDFLFNRKASVSGARQELKGIEMTNKKLVEALDKKEKIQAKQSNGNTVVTVKSFSSSRGHHLIAPGFDVSNLKSLEDSFIMSDRVMKGQLTHLNKIYDGMAKVMDSVFDIKDTKGVLDAGRNAFISHYIDKNGLKETDTLPQVDLTNYSCLKTDVIVMNTGFYLRYVKYDPQSQGHDKNVIRNQKFGFYKGDDINKSAKISLISKKEQAVLVKKWLEDIVKTRESITKNAESLKKDLDNYMKSVDQMKGTGDALHADMGQLLALIISSLTSVVHGGLITIEKTYEHYYKLLKAYHDESVKEYVN